MLLLHFEKVVQPNKQFIIIYHHTLIYLYTASEKTHLTCFELVKEDIWNPLWLHYILHCFHLIFLMCKPLTDEVVESDAPCLEKREKTQKSAHSQQLLKLELQPVLLNSALLGSCKLMRCSN